MAAPKDEKHGNPIGTEAQTVASPDPGADATLPPIPARDAAGISLRGEAVGRYLLGDRIGEGGMGVVYSAYDPQLDRAVAVKLVRIEGEDRRGRDELKARLLREARAMARLSHPNVVAVYDAGEWNDRVFLAMELVRGATTLKAWLAASTRSWREILRVFREAGRGIAAAHAAGVIHRDVKPDNILLDVDGRARITDFGIARAEDVAEPAEIAGVETPDLTRAGRVVGTPAYMAPEVLFGAPADARSDEFSFCVTLHLALYGKRPYPDNRIREGALVHAAEPPPDSRVPPAVRRILLRGLSLRPEDRYPTMEALLADLERAGARGWQGAALAAGVVSVALVAMAVASRHPRENGLCGEMRPLAGAWDADTRAAMASAFEGADAKAGAATWARASKGLERTATEWQGALTATCRAPDDGARLLRVACLEKQRDRFRMLAGVLEKADADVVAHASTAAATL
ncbi:MAG TPA: serine/threonine-protein kinase, partial [bacterium]|nr:serine/threonine-protein kinase [bacterium]